MGDQLRQIGLMQPEEDLDGWVSNRTELLERMHDMCMS